MNLKKKKKGFTLIELMAVIAIIAILAAVLVPTVNGYITRAKKTAVITDVRNVMNAIESYNITATNEIGTGYDLNKTEDKKIMKILNSAGFFDDAETPDSLQDDITYDTLKEINESTDAYDKITITGSKITKWTGTKAYSKSASITPPTGSTPNGQ